MLLRPSRERRRTGLLTAFGVCSLGFLPATGLRPAPAVTPGTSASGSAAGIAVAKLAWTDQWVERLEPGAKDWRRLKAGERVRTGDTVRTAATGLARLEFPWMWVTIGPATELHIPASVVLSTVLKEGRAEYDGQGRDIVKIQTGNAEIRGGGRLVVRRAPPRTLVMAMSGRFRVRAARKRVALAPGQGTLVADGRSPEAPVKLPEPPDQLYPGRDPVYVVSGSRLELRWSPQAAGYHVQVLALGSDDVLTGRDTAAPPLGLEVPWLGTYRWRVASRDARGLEGPPSTDGYICVVDK